MSSLLVVVSRTSSSLSLKSKELHGWMPGRSGVVDLSKHLQCSWKYSEMSLVLVRFSGSTTEHGRSEQRSCGERTKTSHTPIHP